MINTRFFVTGFVDNWQTSIPAFEAETQSEAEIVFNERVSRGDIQVTLWERTITFSLIKRKIKCLN